LPGASTGDVSKALSCLDVRPLIKGYFGVALVVGAVMSSASHEGSSVNSFSADGDPR
jgi:hypothetical protein